MINLERLYIKTTPFVLRLHGWLTRRIELKISRMAFIRFFPGKESYIFQTFAKIRKYTMK